MHTHTYNAIWGFPNINNQAIWIKLQDTYFLHKMQSVWRLLDGFGSYGLPTTVRPVTVPEFPFFRKQLDDDDDDVCALYMMLPEPRGGRDGYAHLVCIDLRSSSGDGVRLLSSRRLARPRLMDRPIVLDAGFLRYISVWGIHHQLCESHTLLLPFYYVKYFLSCFHLFIFVLKTQKQ